VRELIPDGIMYRSTHAARGMDVGGKESLHHPAG